MNEEAIAGLITQLPPAPDAWTRAAKELPAARAALDGIVRRAEADEKFRRIVAGDLEQALREAGAEPDASRVAALRALLES